MKENINLKENERIDDLEYKGLKIIQNKKGFCLELIVYCFQILLKA